MEQTLDSFVIKIGEDTKFVKEILEEFLQLNEKFFSDSPIIHHRFFVILRDYYLNLFQQWHRGESLDETSSFCFETISNLFLKMSSYFSEKDLLVLKDLLCHAMLIDQINRFIEDLSINRNYLEDPQMKSIDHLFRTIQRLQRIPFDSHPIDSLFTSLTKCLCSSMFIEIFLQSLNEEFEHSGHRFLLNTCPEYIYSHAIDQHHEQSLIDIRANLLHPFTQWINEHSSAFRSWNNRMIGILRQISFLLTHSIQLNRNFILSKKDFDDFCQLIDSFGNILYSLIEFDNKFHSSLIGTLVSNFYTLILSNQFERYFQSKHITSLILKLTSSTNAEIQFNALKILSKITIEQDTKNKVYSKNLIEIFIKRLQQMIEEENPTLTFYNLLKCLKNLIHYERIQEELVEQNGLSLILRCVNESKFQSLQIQKPIAEILLTLTFHKEAFQQLKENLSQIKSFSPSSCREYLLWKLENEEQILSKPMLPNREYKYDLFVSYSQCDRQVCLGICEELVKEDFRVWFDETTMSDKSELIDSCEYILLCLSESYKKNCYCRCEASYAYQRQYQIIPLIITSNYRADGWVNRLITGKISIDFSKLDFQSAKMKLKSEIIRHRNIPMKCLDYPCQLDQWTTEDIQLFLTRKNLHSLVPLFSQMNGNLLHELYRMCLANRESMFHTLKSELSTLQSSHQPLTLLIYLRFLHEISKYIPSFVIHRKS